MKKVRGFEAIQKYTGINLPVRSTKNAAGYDFEAAEDTTIYSIWRSFARVMHLHKPSSVIQEAIPKELEKLFKPTLVPTGVKSYMQNDEYLQLTNRSGNPLKNFILLANGVGVIDADYYDNADNEGHIMFQFINFGLFDKKIKKGDRIGQGTFLKFLTVDGDNGSDLAERSGGFGSTGK